MNLEQIKDVIKQRILIDRLELEDITAEEIEDTMPLFGDGLGLDSVEALDVVAGLDAEFGIRLQGTPPEAIKQHFYSVQTLSEFVMQAMAQRQQASAV